LPLWPAKKKHLNDGYVLYLFLTYNVSYVQPKSIVYYAYQIGMDGYFMINIGECSSKDADIVDILEDSLKGILRSRKKQCIDGNPLYLLAMGVESEPELATFFT